MPFLFGVEQDAQKASMRRMPGPLQDIVIAALVGAYTGWVSVRYVSFRNQLQEARRLACRSRDILNRMLRHDEMLAAEAECSDLLMEPAVNLHRMGFRAAAHAMTSSSQGAQLGLFGFWQRLRSHEAEGDVSARETEMRAVRQFEQDLISDINKTRLSISVLLFGSWVGGLGEHWQRRRNKLRARRNSFRDPK
jgi:hypothetical protein